MKITKHEIFDIVELWQRNGCCKINVSLAYSGKTPTVIEVPKIVRDNGRSLKVVECYLEGYGDPHDIKKIRIPAGCSLDAPGADAAVWRLGGIVEEYDTSQTSTNTQKNKVSVAPVPQPQPKTKKGFFAKLFKK